MNNNNNVNKFLISVIVPIYKVENYIAKCLDSIINQSFKNLEIILIDDGSPDRCPEICDEYATKDSRIKVIHKKNGGLSSARNAGLDICKGDYIGFVDGDDYIDEYMYEKLLLSCVNNHTDIAICGRYEESENELKLGLSPATKGIITPEETIHKLFSWDEIDSASWDKLYKAYLWKSIRFPVGIINEDIATIYKIILLANQISLVNEPLYHWITRYDSITHTINYKNMFQFEEITKDILDYFSKSHNSLFYDAKLFRKAAIINTIMYITRIDSKHYKIYKKRLYSYKSELKNYKKEMYFSKTEKYVYYRYIFHLLRFSYYKQRLIKLFNR